MLLNKRHTLFVTFSILDTFYTLEILFVLEIKVNRKNFEFNKTDWSLEMPKVRHF